MLLVWHRFFGILLFVFTTCSDAAFVSYDLNQSSDLPDGRSYLRVSIDDEGEPGKINFHVSVLESLLAFADRNFGIDEFGFNSDFTLSSARFAGLPKNWKFGGRESVDEFGRFDASVEAKNEHAAVQFLAFSITGIKTDDISSYLHSSSGHAREGNFFFFAHVSGIVAPAFRRLDDAYFAGSEFNSPLLTPLPTSAWLLLAGLLASVFAFRNPGRLATAGRMTSQ